MGSRQQWKRELATGPYADGSSILLEKRIKHAVAAVLAALALAAGAAPAQAQVAGSTLVGLGVVEVRQVAEGLSVRKQILGHSVVNENGETIGKIDDVIVAPDASVSYAILGAGGFLGLRKHDVAVPVPMFVVAQDGFVLPGATRDTIRALPAFEYAH